MGREKAARKALADEEEANMLKTREQKREEKGRKPLFAQPPPRKEPTILIEPSSEDPNQQFNSPDLITATGIDAALQALELATGVKGGKESTNLRALFKAFEERQLAILKKEQPTLRRSQMLDHIWKMWQKSPENPMRDKLKNQN